MPTLEEVRRERDARLAARTQASRERDVEAENVRKALKYVEATMLSIVGQDDKESPLIQQMKGDVGTAAGELTQDIVLLIADVLRDLRQGLSDGKLTGAEVTQALFASMSHVGEIVADAAQL